MTTAPLDWAGPAGGPDFEEFARAHTLRLRRLVARRLGDLGEAECIAQETLLRAHRAWSQFADEASAAAWTTVVAQRLAVDHLRVRGRSVPVAELHEGERRVRDTAEVVVARAEARTALAALSAVPDRQAAVLWARQVEGLSYDEIAERHGLSEPTVRSLLHRGRKALRREYAARGGSLPGLFLPLLPLPELLRRLRASRTSWVGGAGAVTAALGVATAVVLPAQTPAPVELPSVRTAVVHDSPAAPAAPAGAGQSAGAPAAPGTSTPAAAAPDGRTSGTATSAPSVVDLLPRGCTDRDAPVGACAGPRDLPGGGVTVSVPLPGQLPVPTELSTDLVGDCPPAATALCRPSEDDDAPPRLLEDLP